MKNEGINLLCGMVFYKLDHVLEYIVDNIERSNFKHVNRCSILNDIASSLSTLQTMSNLILVLAFPWPKKNCYPEILNV